MLLLYFAFFDLRPSKLWYVKKGTASGHSGDKWRGVLRKGGQIHRGINRKGKSFMQITNRNIVTAIILSIVTCGIYGIYWYYMILNDLYTANNLPSKAGTDILLTIVTCGIYGIYMAYQMGKMVNSAHIQWGLPEKDDSVVYLLLFFFGLGIVNYCLVQTDLNDNLGPVVNANMQPPAAPTYQPPVQNQYQPPMQNQYQQPAQPQYPQQPAQPEAPQQPDFPQPPEYPQPPEFPQNETPTDNSNPWDVK